MLSINKNHRRAISAASLVILGLGLSAESQAAYGYSVLTSWSGLDYTKNNSGATSITIHDGECDGHQVSGNWIPFGSQDWKGKVNASGCGTSVSVNTNGRHYAHRVVELVPGSANDYGSWVYPK